MFSTRCAMELRALVPLLLACWLAVAAAQADTTRCVLVMSSNATDDAYSTSLNCTGAHTVVLVAHASQAVNHSVSYRWNGKLVAQNSNTMKANNVRYLTYSNRASSLLAVAYHPTSPCNTGAASCTLELRAQVDSLMLPTAAVEKRDPAYSGITFTNVGTLRIRDSFFDIVKNEVPYVNYSDYPASPPADPPAPWTPGQTYLFDEIYHEDLSAATVVCNSTNRWGMHVSVQRSQFSFSGDPLSTSDYFSYYGGQRSFPNAQLAGLMLTTTGEAGHYRTVNVVNSSFTGHAASRGGGIYVPYCPRPRLDNWLGNWRDRPMTRIQIQSCTFSNNQAYFKGGAVYVGRQCSTAITNSSFFDNNIVYNEPYYHRVMDEYGYRGGAVYAFTPVEFSATDTLFVNNTANAILGMGGALHIDINHTYTPGSATETRVDPRILVSACSFTNNTASTGGAVSVDDVTYNLWWEGDSHINITHCTFTGNAADDGSGALHVSGPSEWAASGSYYVAVRVDTCEFTGNVARSGVGGGIYAEQLRTFVLLNSTLLRNSGGSGGAVGTKFVSAAGIADGVFVANSAGVGDGGAISMESSVLLVHSSLFQNNTVSGSGGAIKALPGTLYASACVFENNAAGVSGGAIAIEQARGATPNPELFTPGGDEQANALLVNFTASQDHSADKLLDILYYVSIPVASQQLKSAYFPTRSELKRVTAFVLASNFTSNTAGGLGGAVLAQGTALVVNQTTFNSNSGSAGGAVAVTDCVGAFNTYESAFTNNSASGFGGAVAASSCDATFNNTLMDGNQGSAGGAVYSELGLAASDAQGTFVLMLTDSSVSRNRATAGSGGGIMAVGVNVTLVGGAAGPDNYAAMMGGGVAVSGAELAVSGTTTSGNSAGGLQERMTYV